MGPKTLATPLPATNVPSLGLRLILIHLYINVVIIYLIRGVRTSGFCGVWEGRKEYTIVVHKQPATLHFEHLCVNVSG